MSKTLESRHEFLSYFMEFINSFYKYKPTDEKKKEEEK